MELRWGERARYTGLFALLAAALFVYPSLSAADGGNVLAALLEAAIPAAALWSLRVSGRALWAGIILGVPATAALVQQAFGVEPVTQLVVKVFPLAFFAYATVMIVRHVVTSQRVNRSVILGAICGYLMLGYTWGMAYAVIHLTDPAAFNGAHTGVTFAGDDFVYFSFVTLTTLGYGDISPATAVARSITMLQAVTGTLYLAVLIARLVGTYRSIEGSAPREPNSS